MRLMISFNNLYFSSLLYFLSLKLASIHAAKFNVKNNCSYTVWAAASQGGGKLLEKGQAWVFNTDPNFRDRGRIWGRTNCKFDEKGTGKCETGDCGGLLYCLPSSGGVQPYTLAEYTFQSSNHSDSFGISLVFGFNVPMEFSGTSSNCTQAIKCAGDINGLCPTEFRHPGGCYHPCTAFNNTQFCCPGGKESCDRTEAYFKFFQDLCPNVYTYAYDDPTGIFTCQAGSDYKVVFCP